MPVELRDMKVDFLSLVSKGANGKRIIWKAGQSPAPDGKTAGDKKPEGADAFETPLRKLVKSDEKRMVYGIVYGPGQVDSQGEYAEKGEIEKAAYGFMKGLRLLNVDAQHDFDPKAAFVAESWITKGADPLFPDEPEGSWAVGIRVEDEALWASVKKGELAGLSMAGYAAKVRKGEDGVLAKMEQFFTRLLKAVEGAEAKNAQPRQPAETKPGAGAPTGEEAAETEAVEKVAKALEGIPALVEAVAKLDGRLKALEAATPGRMSKGVDGGAADDSYGFL